MLQEIINALQRIFLAHDVQDDTVIISVLVPGAQQAEESASDDRLVAFLNDKDNLINLGKRHVQYLRGELDLAKLQIEELQKNNADLKKLTLNLHRRLFISERANFQLPNV